MVDAFRWPARDVLTVRTAATPDRTALVDAPTDRSWTYRDLDRLVDAAASRLRQHAVTDETAGRPRIALLLSPRPAFLVTLYAVWRLGWTVAPLNTSLPADTLGDRLDRLGPAGLVCAADSDPPTGHDACPTVTVDALVPAVFDDAGGAADSRVLEDSTVEPARWEPTATALLLFTSGTTGEPKGVRLTLYNLVSSATAAAFRLGVDPGDRWLCCLPVYHMGGLAPAVRTVCYGTTLVFQRSFDAERTATVLSDRSVTGVSLVPTQLKRLLDAGWSPESTLRTVLLGGAPASDDLLSRATAAGVPVCPTYGLTEAASQVATALPADVRTRPGTVGQPLVGTTVTVVDDGDPVTPGERGELVVDGPTVTPGYLDGERDEAAFGEWGLHTGDVGYRDDAGRLWVLGRRDGMILTGGELVAPREVQEAVRTHPDIAAAAVVGLPDEEWGERVAALVVPESDAAAVPGSDALRDHCREQLAAFKLPQAVGVAEQLPRTQSGTVDREAVRERFGE